MSNLLTRDQFKVQVFKRDHNKCVVCSKEAIDAHHIIERRLWDDFGYYVDNGVSVCANCHIKAEQTLISCDELRTMAGIKNVIIPDHFYSDERYDKWGNILLSHNRRIPGELFYDESVQKILKIGGVLSLFSKYIKYPRTYHLPWSPGTKSEDRLLKNVDHFKDKQVIITEKMDGENTTLYRNYIHARSIDMDSHPSRDWIKAFHANIKYEIPDGWRICGENMYAKHSIYYPYLKSYFMLFNIWNDKNICLSWKDTLEWAKLLNIEIVHPVYQTNNFSEGECKFVFDLWKFEQEEGYVIRITDSFPYSKFRHSVAKYVRAGHVAGSEHWRSKKVEPNGLVNVNI